MAILKVIHEAGKYHDDNAYKDVIHYATSHDKVREDGVIGASVVPEIAPAAMKAVTKAYHKNDGVKLRHAILSFGQEENIDFDKAKQIATQAMGCYAEDYQMMAAIHEDQENLHVHFIMNTVNYNDGSKYRGTKADYYGFLRHIDEVLRPYGTYVCPAK